MCVCVIYGQLHHACPMEKKKRRYIFISAQVAQVLFFLYSTRAWGSILIIGRDKDTPPGGPWAGGEWRPSIHCGVGMSLFLQVSFRGATAGEKREE